MKTSEALREGYDHLLVHGWCQRALIDEQGRRCMLGALDAAVTAGRESYDVFLRGAAVLCRAIDTDALVATWNDWPTRTFNQVCDVYLKAIKLAEADEANS